MASQISDGSQQPCGTHGAIGGRGQRADRLGNARASASRRSRRCARGARACAADGGCHGPGCRLARHGGAGHPHPGQRPGRGSKHAIKATTRRSRICSVPGPRPHRILTNGGWFGSGAWLCSSSASACSTRRQRSCAAFLLRQARISRLCATSRISTTGVAGLTKLHPCGCVHRARRVATSSACPTYCAALSRSWPRGIPRPLTGCWPIASTSRPRAGCYACARSSHSTSTILKPSPRRSTSSAAWPSTTSRRSRSGFSC